MLNRWRSESASRPIRERSQSITWKTDLRSKGSNIIYLDHKLHWSRVNYQSKYPMEVEFCLATEFACLLSLKIRLGLFFETLVSSRLQFQAITDFRILITVGPRTWQGAVGPRWTQSGWLWWCQKIFPVSLWPLFDHLLRSVIDVTFWFCRLANSAFPNTKQVQKWNFEILEAAIPFWFQLRPDDGVEKTEELWFHISSDPILSNPVIGSILKLSFQISVP